MTLLNWAYSPFDLAAHPCDGDPVLFLVAARCGHELLGHTPRHPAPSARPCRDCAAILRSTR